jgi:zinc and cadmium transporter
VSPGVLLTLQLLALVMGTLAGGCLPLLTRLSRERLFLPLSFGSGVLLAVIFIEMIPEVTQRLGRWGGVPVLLGFLLTSLLESGLHAHRHSGEGDSLPTADGRLAGAGGAMVAGLGVHSFMDGLALGSGLSAPAIGGSLFFAILVHKGPDAFALSTVLLAGGVPRTRILRLQGLFSLATPLGAGAALLALRGLPEGVVGFAVGGAAGSLLGVATEDLLPEVHRRGRHAFLGATLALLAGVAGVAALRLASG